MFKGTPGIENIVAATNMQGSTGESERPEYLRVGREKSGFQDLESSVSQDWPSLYQWAIDNVMQNPTEGTLQDVYCRLEENCPDEYKAMLNPTLQLLQGYVKNEKQKGIDDMTGLYNQNTFYETLDNVLSKAERQGNYVSVLAIDGDKFKEVNDNFGHQEGDRVVQYVADAIQSVVRQEDMVARYGGDEFAVILDNTDSEGAYSVAERIQEDMKNNPFKLQDGSQMYVPNNQGNISLSLGIATSAPGNRQGSQDLYNNADKACYEAKKSPDKISTFEKPYKILPIEGVKAA